MTEPTLRNWAGNVVFAPSRLHLPRSLTELQRAVAGAEHIRAIGTGHSFNEIAQPRGESVSLAELPADIDIRPDDSGDGTATVTVSGGVRFGQLAPVLHEAGWALRNLGSLPHIAVAGAISTGTHGSGDGNRVLADSVEAISYVSPTGDLITVDRSDPDFHGSVIALGALGIAARVTLSLVPAFDIRQWVYEDLPLRSYAAHLDEVTGPAYSSSAFTDWRSGLIGGLWLKQLAKRDSGTDAPRSLFEGRLATVAHHPIPGENAGRATVQLGEAGPWFERLPHFQLAFTPSAGEELQSEYFVAREHAAAAISALSELGELIAPQLLISEIRTIAADDFWISPFSGRDSVALHFTWKPDRAAVDPVLAAIENALLPLDFRTHWGKVFAVEPVEFDRMWPQLDRFSALVRRHDPEGKFGNHFIDRYVHRAASA